MTSPMAVQQAQVILNEDRAHIETVEDRGSTMYVKVTIHDLEGMQLSLMSTDLEIDHDTSRIVYTCTCSDETCSHLAVSLFLCGPILGFGDADSLPPPPPPAPAWQRALDDVLPPLPDTSRWQEICLLFKVEKGTRNGHTHHLGIRPGVRGTNGNWIKGKVSWANLQSIFTDPVVEGALDTLYETYLRSGSGYGGYSYFYRARGLDWLPLHQMEPAGLWQNLMQMRAAGVEFIDWDTKSPVGVESEPIQPRFTVSQKGSTLRVGAELQWHGQSVPQDSLLFIGEPAVAAAALIPKGSGQQLTLAPLERPIDRKLRQLTGRKNKMQVKPAEREAFESTYLPRLQVTAPVESPDGTYQPPAAARAKLIIEVNYSDKSTHLSYTWDRGPLGTRDLEWEDAVSAAVRDAAEPRPELLFDDDGVLRDRTLMGGHAVLVAAEVLPKLQELDDVELRENETAPQYRSALEPPKVALETGSEDPDWFDLHFLVTIEDQEVEFSELFRALAQEEPVFLLPDGTYFPLETPELDQLREIIQEASTLNDRPVDKLRLSKYQVDLWEELVSLGVVEAQANQWWKTVQGLSSSAELVQLEPPETLDAELRDYQQTGYSWLSFLRENGLGGILADDMGLGKTLQAIAMMERARADNPQVSPFLIVAPTSVMGNWVRETQRFAPDLKIAGITETEKRRGVPLNAVVGGNHVVVTSYALFRLEFEKYEQLEWSGLILDEAQMVKNHASRGYRCARMLRAPFKLVITGTPMENNLLELWALASLTCPGLLGSREHFIDVYQYPVEKEKDAERLATLQRRLSPFLLRRRKELVAKELPPKQEQVMELELHPTHRKLYDRRLQRERQKVLGLVGDMQGNRFEIFRSLTLLRQLALDAELTGDGEAPSAKLDALGELLSEVVVEGHKVLVLSQFTRFLNKARDTATTRGIQSSYLDGKTRNRQTVIDTFREGKSSVFFISLKAGGFGLNLTEADYVVLLDPWWNPATETQAVDRTHRIGQDKNVMVYRMVSENTIESKVMALKESKLQLFDRVLDGGGAAESATLSADDIKELLA